MSSSQKETYLIISHVGQRGSPPCLDLGQTLRNRFLVSFMKTIRRFPFWDFFDFFDRSTRPTGMYKQEISLELQLKCNTEGRNVQYSWLYDNRFQLQNSMIYLFNKKKCERKVMHLYQNFRKIFRPLSSQRFLT